MTILDDNNETTNFGFDIVSKYDKPFMISKVFHSVAKKYDFMNDLMSFGLHRIWKTLVVKYSEVKSGDVILDLACGTGDIAYKFFSIFREKNIKVILVDINDAMLLLGRDKLRDFGIINDVFYVQGDAEFLPFSDKIFDCVTISFGLRNITDVNRALHSIYRVLKFGGRVLILEFSTPVCKYFKMLYDIYSFSVLPRIGSVVASDYDSYRYLVESIRVHPNQEKLCSMISEIGFCGVEYFNIMGGIVALHRGYKL